MSLFFIYFLLSALNFELFSISLQRKKQPFHHSHKEEQGKQRTELWTKDGQSDKMARSWQVTI